MREASLILGINRTQEASDCLLRGSQLDRAIQKEGLTPRKTKRLAGQHSPPVARLLEQARALLRASA